MGTTEQDTPAIAWHAELPASGPRSRDSAGAAWSSAVGQPEWRTLMRRRKRTVWGHFSWISPAPLLASVNDLIAKGVSDLVNDRRPRWIAAQRAAGRAANDFRVDAHAEREDVSFLVVGDPGERDPSQYAVVQPLLATGKDTDFMIVASDVIYPAGDVNDYVDGFYLPYANYPAPIYAIPGNHDWYDGLSGFMFNFCGAEPLGAPPYRRSSYTPVERLAQRLWRNPAHPDRQLLLRYRARRPPGWREEWAPPQPGPYIAIETPNLLVIGIDTGITGTLDREQGEWLLRLSATDPRPKVLVTGKPIYVDGDYHPCRIEWRAPHDVGSGDPEDRWDEDASGRPLTVDDIVRDPAHRYVAAIGGDIHNYQRYPVPLEHEEGAAADGTDGDRPPPPRRRVVEYIVAGGGGAYLNATHRIPQIDLTDSAGQLPTGVGPVKEDRFRCYPLRGDSLALFTRRVSPVLFGLLLAALGGLVLGVVLLVAILGVDKGMGGMLGHKPLWAAAVAVPGVLVAAALACLIGWVVGSRFPSGYRTFGALVGAGVAVGVGLWTLDPLLSDEWGWLWKVAAATVAVVVVPFALVVASQLTRGVGPQAYRSLPLALAVVAGIYLLIRHTAGLDPSGVAAHAGLIAAGLVALAAVALALYGLRRPATRPESDRLRLRAGWLAGFAIGAGIPVVAAIRWWGDTWIPRAAVAAAATLALLAAALAVAVFWRGAVALPLLLRARHVDPDVATAFVADRLHATARRASAKAASVPRGDSWILALVYGNPVLKGAVSWLEAISPPFFKSFLRLDVRDTKLVISAYGVTGYESDEGDPPLEDQVEIDLAP